MAKLTLQDIIGQPIERALLDYLEAELRLARYRQLVGPEIVSTNAVILDYKRSSDQLKCYRFTALQCDQDQGLSVIGTIGV